MNGTDLLPPRSHTRFIVGAITILGTICALAGAVLIWKGYHGDLFIGGTLAAISGLVGMLSVGKPLPPPPDVTISGQPPKVALTHPETSEPKP